MGLAQTIKTAPDGREIRPNAMSIESTKETYEFEDTGNGEIGKFEMKEMEAPDWLNQNDF